MPESITRPGILESKIPEEEQSGMPEAVQHIIWTPRFLLIFALTLVVGTSLESVLASAWSTGVWSEIGHWFILGHLMLLTLGWLVLGIVTGSRWIRVSCIFGGIFVIFLGLNVFTSLNGIDASSPLQASINAATCLALLGAYIGLSIEGTSLGAWDISLFWLALLVGGAALMVVYRLTAQSSPVTLENALAALALSAAGLFWWARPSCWKKQPGPTLLLGSVPFILLSLALVNASAHNFFLLDILIPHTVSYTEVSTFFFAQFVLLCLFLGCLRLIKSEIVN